MLPRVLRKNKGFTLIQLVVVIAILGILAGIAIPRYLDMQEEAIGARVLADLTAIDSAATLYATRNGRLPYRATSHDTIEYKNNINQFVPGYLTAWPVAPSGTIRITGFNGKVYRYQLKKAVNGSTLDYAWNGPLNATVKDDQLNMATLGRSTIDMLKSGNPNTKYFTIL